MSQALRVRPTAAEQDAKLRFAGVSEGHCTRRPIMRAEVRRDCTPRFPAGGAALVTATLILVIAQLLPASRVIYLSGMAIDAACAVAFTFALDTKGTASVLRLHAIAGAFAGLDCTRLT